MLNNLDAVNLILASMVDEGFIEPIDEADCHPLDWATVTGLMDEVFDEIYPYAEA